MTDIDLVQALQEALSQADDSWRSQPSVLRRRLEAVLGPDALPQRSRVHLLVVAAEERVPAQLSRSDARPEALARVATELADARGWTPEAAEFAVRTWSSALAPAAPVRDESATVLPEGPLPATILPDAQAPGPSAPLLPPPPADGPDPVGRRPAPPASVLPLVAAPPPPPAPSPAGPPPPVADPLPPPPPGAAPDAPAAASEGVPLPPPAVTPTPTPDRADLPAAPAPPSAPAPAPPSAPAHTSTPTTTAAPSPTRRERTLRTKASAALGRKVDDVFAGYVDGHPRLIVASVVGLCLAGLVAIAGIMAESQPMLFVGLGLCTAAGVALASARQKVPVHWIVVVGDEIVLVETQRDRSNTPVPTRVVGAVPRTDVTVVEGSPDTLRMGPHEVVFLRSKERARHVLLGGR